MNRVLASEYAAWLNDEKEIFGAADQKLADEYAAWISEDAEISEASGEVQIHEDSDDPSANATDADDDDDNIVEPEPVAGELADERTQVLESEIYQDEHPSENTDPVDAIGTETLKHEMLKTAIGRIESAARTQRDFENVVVCWDKLEQNAVRRTQNHELPRGDVPLEYGRTMDGAIFPKCYTLPRWRQILHGYFLEVIHDCPFEMDELTVNVAVSNAIRSLKDEHKVIFYWHYLRQLSCAEIGHMRGQTDRNIRKTRAVIIRKLQKQLKITGLGAWRLQKLW